MEIFDFLSDLFGGGGQSPQAPSSGGGSYSWIGPLISAVGNVAGRARWTPRADATASDIREANRNNMIAQLLGAGAQAYQGYQEQQAYGSLADLIKQGSMTTTTPQSPLSSQIFGWGQANPQFAKTATALGLDQLQKEQQNAAQIRKAELAAQKPLSFGDLANIATLGKAQGVPETMMGEFIQRTAEQAGRGTPMAPQLPSPTERIEQSFQAPQQSTAVDALRGGMSPEEQGTARALGVSDEDIASVSSGTYGQYGGQATPSPTPAAPTGDFGQRLEETQSRLQLQNDAKQIRETFQKSPNYKTVVSDVAKGQKAYSDMVAKINEITKRGRFLPQDTFALAKLYNQILEPGLQVTEQEVKQSISSPEQWQNSSLGKAIQAATGALWLDDQNVGALLGDAAGMMNSRQQAASDYIQREKETLGRLGYSEKALQILDQELTPLDYQSQYEGTLSQLKNLSKKKSKVAEGPGIKGLTPGRTVPLKGSSGQWEIIE